MRSLRAVILFFGILAWSADARHGMKFKVPILNEPIELAPRGSGF
jgi:hypothetical protein